MGVLRVLLALSVALSHLGESILLSLAGGVASVQAFYIISGFYMATILTEKYDPRKDMAVFYSNRALRIYSIYFISLAISLVAYTIIYRAGQGGWLHYVIHNIGKIDTLGQAWLAFTSLFIIGEESTLFLEIKDGALAFTPNGPSGPVPVWYFLPVPQAWSISLELMFYALVPFLIRNSTRVLWGIVAATLILRATIYAIGYQTDPWVSRFFPTELGLFVGGMCARRVYDAFAHRVPRAVLLPIGVAFVVVTCFLNYLMQHFPLLYVIWPYYAFAVIAVPALFALTRQSKLDQFLGSFSYPLYLIHWVVIWFYDAFAASWGMPLTGSPARIAICVAVSFLLSWVIVISVEAPLDRYRQRRVAAMAA